MAAFQYFDAVHAHDFRALHFFPVFHFYALHVMLPSIPLYSFHLLCASPFHAFSLSPMRFFSSYALHLCASSFHAFSYYPLRVSLLPRY